MRISPPKVCMIPSLIEISEGKEVPIFATMNDPFGLVLLYSSILSESGEPKTLILVMDSDSNSILTS